MGIAWDAQNITEVREGIEAARTGNNVRVTRVDQNGVTVQAAGAGSGTVIPPQLFREYMRAERDAGRGDQIPPSLIQAENTLNAMQIQNQQTRPAAPVRPGTVIGGGMISSITVSPDGERTPDVRVFRIVAGENGTMQAHTGPRHQPEIITNQVIMATVNGVNGTPPRQVQLRADNVGNLTEIPAQQVPQGRGQSTKEQR